MADSHTPLLVTYMYLLLKFFSDSIQIYPKELYFGGTLTQVILTCQPSQSCTDTIKWFKGTTEVDTSPNKYSTAVNYINNYQTLTVNDAMEADAGTYHCQCTFDGTSVNSPTATVIHKCKFMHDIVKTREGMFVLMNNFSNFSP